MSQTEAYTDVVELCALLQCLGFSVKSLDTSDGNASQDGGMRTVVINCQSSGLHVVLENPSLSCSCPNTKEQNSGVWQVSGVTGGKHLDKEFGCSLLGSLPKGHRDRLTKELHDLIKCMKQHNDSDIETPKEAVTNKSASMLELKTPDKGHYQIKVDTPTRYRSLDTLTAVNKEEAEPSLPAPGLLQRANIIASAAVEAKEKRKIMCRRESTYTLSSTPGSVRRRNKTSSPIQAPQSSILDSLIAAEKAAEDLHTKLAFVIREFMEEDGKHDSSISSLALDVSKISVLKCSESKAQFASSPNLSGIGNKEDLTKSRLKRFESASTSNLGPNSATKESKLSKLRRLSPNLFKTKKEASSDKTDKKTQETRTKLNCLFKPRIVTPVRTPRANIEASPNLSASARKKFSHVKSTIPRPAKKE